jgi:hypothetical protein
MRNRFLNNWQAKLAALLIALAIWVYEKNQVQPEFLDQVMHNILPGK